MDNLNYAAFAAPAFFFFLFLEYMLARRQKKAHLFNYEGSVANISIGIAERLLNLFVSVGFYRLYEWVYANYAIFDIPKTWWVWLLLLLATDLAWYWYHRLGHEINFLWAAHIVHHQSDEFNFTVSARITTLQAAVRTLFWCALPLLGFAPVMVMTILVVHGAYSFFTHTQMIPRVRWLEYVLVTPSIHGIHHASDEKYLDKNFGDVFVCWDMLFGTYKREEEPPRYGLTHPLKSYSFLWQHFHYYLEIAEAFRRARTVKAKWNAVFGNPAGMDQNIRPLLEERWLQNRGAQIYKYKFRGYINLQLVISVVLLLALTLFYAYVDVIAASCVLCFILLTLINIGALLEQRQWIYYLECFRLILVSGYVLYIAGLPELALLPTVLLIVLERTFELGRYYRKYVLRYEPK
ncbi:sterol desaturase family protein [Pedobacter sp. SYP-B3415]|uniref:sterol desaturase family protein n=1 Tax=Pedobacter sp. SYP-B3415 TaxID=2496641 RepID=UPI00101DDC75|nr:sterol desaturase family protein [Pedobacter sp. SYP-B3415]